MCSELPDEGHSAGPGLHRGVHRLECSVHLQKWGDDYTAIDLGVSQGASARHSLTVFRGTSRSRMATRDPKEAFVSDLSGVCCGLELICEAGLCDELS